MWRLPTGMSITYLFPFDHILCVRGLTTFVPEELHESRSKALSRSIPFFILLKPNFKISFLFQFRQRKLTFIPIMKTFETLSEAIAGLKSKGYKCDFNLHPERIECPPLNLQLRPTEFHVDEVHRFEGMNNPDDSSILFAIQSTNWIKGLLVDAYGVYAESLSSEND